MSADESMRDGSVPVEQMDDEGRSVERMMTGYLSEEEMEDLTTSVDMMEVSSPPQEMEDDNPSEQDMDYLFEPLPTYILYPLIQAMGKESVYRAFDRCEPVREEFNTQVRDKVLNDMMTYDAPAGYNPHEQTDFSSKWWYQYISSGAPVQFILDAIDSGDEQAVRRWLDGEMVDNNANPEDSSTMANLTLQFGQLSVANLLRSRRAEVNNGYPGNMTDLDHIFWDPFLLKMGRHELMRVMQLLIGVGEHFTRLEVMVALLRNPDARQLLSKAVVNDQGILDLRNRTGYTVLHMAAGYGTLDCCRDLVEQAPWLLTAESCEGVTPLHVAIIQGNQDTALYLIEGGTLLQRSTFCVYTEAFMACVMKKKRVVRELLHARHWDAYSKAQWGSDAQLGSIVSYRSYDDTLGTCIDGALGEHRIHWPSYRNQLVAKLRDIAYHGIRFDRGNW
ncbi:ankyrin [Aspergillus heteromorphus CBS 117.55]|uniref:Ankyrin n=1 Tax=Aspergillus heteromorphus CBS 117.55 TaxID=1448321 RepID=A0A317W4R6_9EURO|nr:ankyrin [Aspergillus heteromorphus CBS 117.55]PWY79180.1 ankyrin [Aspergillus heteromorphus CBS 117.55]